MTVRSHQNNDGVDDARRNDLYPFAAVSARRHTRVFATFVDRTLTDELAHDVARLRALVGRDLPEWRPY